MQSILSKLFSINRGFRQLHKRFGLARLELADVVTIGVGMIVKEPCISKFLGPIKTRICSQTLWHQRVDLKNM